MNNHKIHEPLLVAVSLVTLVLTCQTSLGQENWNTYIHAGQKALQGGRYAEAEKLFRDALKEAEALGLEDPRVATTLNDLAFLYDIQGKHAQAEPPYRRALEIWEKALGSEHPLVAFTLERTASLLRKLRRETEAAELEARARAIQAKQAR